MEQGLFRIGNSKLKGIWQSVMDMDMDVNMNSSCSEPKKLAVISAVDMTLRGLVLAQMKAAQKAGYQVYGICTKGKHVSALANEGIYMYPITLKRYFSPLNDIAALWRLFRFFKKEKITIVHTHTPKASLLGQMAAKMAGVPIIINTVHGYHFHEHMEPLHKWFFIFIAWFSSRFSTLIFSQNPEDIDTAIRLKIASKKKLCCLGNGVNISTFAPELYDENYRRAKRREIGLPEDAIVVGVIGRLVREKGFLELFSVVQKLIPKHPNLRLVIIGIEEKEKKNKISPNAFTEYGIQDKTVWLGEKENKEIPALLKCFDIYAFPSWKEGFPRSAIEATAMGLPIVAYNIRGCRQVVDHGKNGYLVPIHDVDQFADAIERLICDESLRRQMGQAGRIKAQKEFDEKKICEVIIKTYNGLYVKRVLGHVQTSDQS